MFNQFSSKCLLQKKIKTKERKKEEQFWPCLFKSKIEKNKELTCYWLYGKAHMEPLPIENIIKIQCYIYSWLSFLNER